LYRFFYDDCSYISRIVILSYEPVVQVVHEKWRSSNSGIDVIISIEENMLHDLGASFDLIFYFYHCFSYFFSCLFISALVLPSSSFEPLINWKKENTRFFIDAHLLVSFNPYKNHEINERNTTGELLQYTFF